MNTRLSIYKMLLFLCVISLAAGSLWSSPDIEAQLRLYEGFKVKMPAPAKVITSYYLKPISDKNIQSDVDIDKEKNSLKKVFNLKDIKIITKAAMVLSEDGKSPFQVIVLNGRKLLLQLNPLKNQKNRFKVEVMETDIASGSLLKTQIHLPEKKTTVLGFKDSSGKIYFLSFHRGKDVQPLSSKDIKNITANKQPKLVKSVPPKYPKAAIKAGISGSIMINATTDATGKVVDVDVIVGPKELRQAAVDAIKQWVYKPYILDNEPTPVRFTVIVKFNLDSKKKKKEPLAISSKKRPKLIKNP
ncbi:MAG: energy transducer TonB, partial [bacterium]|nr:energy transducer TonB [bacterium]